MKKLAILFLTIWMYSCHQLEVVPVQIKQPGLTLNDKDVLILVDGKQVMSDKLKMMDPNTIESVEVIKGPDVKRYTTANYKGVIKISLKKI